MNVFAFLGEIRMYGGKSAPEGWAFCDGSLLPISQYDMLFMMIQTTFGGDGQTTFGLPDLRSRVPIHLGQDGDTPNLYLGQPAGFETVAVGSANSPAHSHPVTASTADGNFRSPNGSFFADAVTPFIPPGPQEEVSVYAPTSAGKVVMNSNSVSYTGSAPLASLVQCYQVVNYIIALDGEPFRPQD